MHEARSHDAGSFSEDDNIDLRQKLEDQIKHHYCLGEVINFDPIPEFKDKVKDLPIEQLRDVLLYFKAQKEKKEGLRHDEREKEKVKNLLNSIGGTIEYLCSCKGVVDMLLSDDQLVECIKQDFNFVFLWVPKYVETIGRLWSAFLKAKIEFNK